MTILNLTTKRGSAINVEIGDYLDKARVVRASLPSHNLSGCVMGKLGRAGNVARLTPEVEADDPALVISANGKNYPVILSRESAAAIEAAIEARQREIDAAIPTHENCWCLWGDAPLAVQYANQYGVSILPARYAPEGEWADWCKDTMMVGTGRGLRLERIEWSDLPQRPNDGQFPSCENTAWWITADEARALVALDRARADGAKAAADAESARLAAVAIPEAALRAYDRYRGDEERAWGEGDEGAWSLIREYKAAIEHRHGMHPEAARAMLKAIDREASYGITDDQG
jgi:hypothetical protein